MRAWLVSAVLLGGCPMTQGGGECTTDGQCSGSELCARDGTCKSPSTMRDVKATWTIRGMAATATSCAGHGDLYIQFEGGPGESLGYSPVPCAIGQFTITKLPKTYDRVELGVTNGTHAFAVVDATGMARLDLVL
jgi:hypothetical protein